MRWAAVLLASTWCLASGVAQANEAYVEATGGGSWNDEATDAIGGFALGYDVDVTETVFVGVEATAEKLLTDGTRVHGALAAAPARKSCRGARSSSA